MQDLDPQLICLRRLAAVHRDVFEFNGIDPDVLVEVVPEELTAGKNSAILRAREYIVRETAGRSTAK